MTQEYSILFNAISDAVEALQKAQVQAEDTYIFRDETFLFRGIGTSDVGLVHAQSAEEAYHIICECYGKSFELVTVPDDFTYFQPKLSS